MKANLAEALAISPASRRNQGDHQRRPGLSWPRRGDRRAGGGHRWKGNEPALFNTLTREIEEFRPIERESRAHARADRRLYDYAHIGNFRAYIFEDLLQRHLEFRGYQVERVMNLTDVDDKTIRGARARECRLRNLLSPSRRPSLRISTRCAFAAPIIFQRRPRQKLHRADDRDDRGAHRAWMCLPRRRRLRLLPDQSHFHDTVRSRHFNLDELQSTGRVRSDEYEKEEASDFALWKAWDREDGEVWWESPWGRGRPGWHIECSAMATAILGPQIDVHCGGEDNIFPHHEAEIAQTECVTKMPFVRLWMHCKHLLVDGRKMSKSENNFFTLRDLKAQGLDRA